MRTHRLCMRCDTEVKRETVVKQYPFYCPKCDENLFRFETFNVKQMRGPIIPYRGEHNDCLPSFVFKEYDFTSDWLSSKEAVKRAPWLAKHKSLAEDDGWFNVKLYKGGALLENTFGDTWELDEATMQTKCVGLGL